jgi:hypothetical protein
LGKNGDPIHDSQYIEFEKSCNNLNLFNYKQLCGSFSTSSGFAVWLAGEILNMKKAPFDFDRITKIEHIFIYHCNNNYHSLMCINKC